MDNLISKKVRKFERNLMKKEYVFFSEYWKQCIKEQNMTEANRCQRESHHLVWANRLKFTVFYDKWKNNKNIFATEAFVRRAEVNLITFRNFAQLDIMILLTLIETYKDDNTVVGRKILHRYQQYLCTSIKFYYDYLSWSVGQVKRAYASYSISKNDYKCKKISETRKGFFRVHTADQYTCYARLGYSEPKTSKCELYLTERVDGKHPHRNYYCCGAMQVGGFILEKKFRYYHRKEIAAVRNYMISEFRDTLKQWANIQRKHGHVAKCHIPVLMAMPINPRRMILAKQDAAELLF